MSCRDVSSDDFDGLQKPRPCQSSEGFLEIGVAKSLAAKGCDERNVWKVRILSCQVFHVVLPDF